MISIQEALDLVISQPVSHREMDIKTADSLNFHLAEDLVAKMDLPSFDNSAMDGYAVRGKGPVFQLIGEIQAGNIQSLGLSEGEAYRIFTGAKVPSNTDAVIMQEKTEMKGQQLTVLDEVVHGKNIRYKGEQIKEGQIVFEKGQKINPSVMGLLYSLGILKIKVAEPPKISMLTTGSELVKPGNELREGQLYESNGATIQAAAKQYGFEIHKISHVADDFHTTRKAIEKQLTEADILLVSGGISVGNYDHVKGALEECGVSEIFYKVRQKPGKPLFFGRKEDTFVFGLPGNPASSLVCFYVYVLPLLLKLSGSNEVVPHRIYVPLASDYHMPFDRPSFLKSRISSEGVTILDGQGSSMILSMAKGNSLVLLEGQGTYQKGSMVECITIR